MLFLEEIATKDTSIMTNGSTTNESASISINGGSIKSKMQLPFTSLQER